MTECLPQKFLRDGGTLAELESSRGIKHNRHTRFPQLVQLTYDQISSPMADPLVQQCRSIILDESQDWEVVAWPFNKFFNHGEGHAAAIDWQSARVQEKIDGSITILYHYTDRKTFTSEWCVATSGRADAGGNINGMDITFERLFWTLLPPDVLKLTDRHVTYMFELTSSLNRVVCLYPGEPRLILLGGRDRETGEEIPVRDLHVAVSRVQEFPLKSIENVLATFEAMSPLNQEGYVIVDRDFNRIKVKHPGYVALHHMKSCLTPRGVLEVVRSGETEEVVATFPEWKRLFDDVKMRYDRLVAELENQFFLTKDIKDQKEFALTIQGKLGYLNPESTDTVERFIRCPCTSALFSARSGRATIREHLKSMQIDSLAAIIGLNPREFPVLDLES